MSPHLHKGNNVQVFATLVQNVKGEPNQKASQALSVGIEP